MRCMPGKLRRHRVRGIQKLRHGVYIGMHIEAFAVLINDAIGRWQRLKVKLFLNRGTAELEEMLRQDFVARTGEEPKYVNVW